MKHLTQLDGTHLDQPSIVTIGVFDGVHRGHQHLLHPLVERAHATGKLAVVLTLFPHPDIVIRGLTGRYYLTPPDYRADLLGDLGVDVVVTLPFNDEVRHIRAADFVRQLRDHLHMDSLWLTADFAMGYQREGNFEFLSKLGQEQGFEVERIDLLADSANVSSSFMSAVISSSNIREALLAGQVEQAAQWLGRPYRISGTVIHGDHRGRTIGFPTANIDVWSEQVLPAYGVYACWVYLNGQRMMAVTNVGERPTFDGKDLRVEAHILDFDADIYGQTLAVDFVSRLRGEQKFDGFEALVAQIRADAQRGRELLTTLA
jgi:riboflavin kinase / FMN adenylyltransferase